MLSNTRLSHRFWWGVLGVCIFVLPPLLALAWGPYFADTIYGALGAARVVASGDFAGPPGVPSYPRAPLFVLFLAAVGGFAGPIALALSALGWSVTAFAALAALKALDRSWAGVCAALLIALNPLIFTAAGAEYSWVLALGWIALALSAGLGVDRWRPSTIVWIKWLALALMLGLQLDAAAILFALALLAVDVYEERAGWRPFLFLAAAALIAGLLLPARPGSPGLAGSAFALQDGRSFFGRWGIAWLFVPFILAGLYDFWSGESLDEEPASGAPRRGREILALALLWALVSIIAGSPSAAAVVIVLALVLAAAGVAWLGSRLLNADRLMLDPRRGAAIALALPLIPLLLIEIFALGRTYLARPVLHYELQAGAAAWLEEHADPGATLYGAQRLGYLADLATMPAQLERVNDGNVGEVYARLLPFGPDFIVTEQTLPWNYVTGTTWFKDRYVARARFDHAYAPDAPITIWQYRPSPFDAGERQAIEAVVPGHLALVGYQFEPRVITPGEDVYLTIYLQALEPVSTGFFTVAHLAATDGWVWAWREEQTPRSLPGAWWAPGQVIPERIRLGTTADLPPGAYDLQLFWRASDNKTGWPIYRDGDDTVLDRLHLGYVVAPPPAAGGEGEAVDARFADEILMEAVEIAPLPKVAPGESLAVTLYWNAMRQPSADYTVFLHLLDEDGQIVAAHDGMPVENRFPTRAFIPGNVVADARRLELPADLAPGVYRLNAGLYLLETGERLPVWDAEGVEQADRSLTLAEIEVGR